MKKKEKKSDAELKEEIEKALKKMREFSARKEAFIAAVGKNKN